MSSLPSTTASVRTMATGLIALTSPYTQAPGCESHWTRTSLPSTLPGGTTTVVAALVSTPVASCYPSGWRSGESEDRNLHFSPAVCPSGWVYNSMAQVDDTVQSTAFCCNSGYYFHGSDDVQPVSQIFKRQCQRWTQGTLNRVQQASASQGTISTTATDETMMVHEAWAVTWDMSDRSTLTPEMPLLTSSKLVPTWTAGQVIQPGQYDPETSEGRFISDAALKFLMIGMPIIGVFLIGSCIFACVRIFKSKKRKQAQQKEAVQNDNRKGDEVGGSTEI